ncbi:MAG: type II toxin-antitoxin system VapC family toxin [Promethearchaeota archaeon]
MSIYIDTNVFYTAYCPIEERVVADWLLKQLEPKFFGITSEWTIIEMFRALNKQVNLGRFEEEDAQITIDLFLTDIGEYSQKKKLILVPVKKTYILNSRKIIFTNNLYATDAIHLVTAIEMKVDVFITFDNDFKKLKKLPILNPSDKNFKNDLIKIKSKYIKK